MAEFEFLDPGPLVDGDLELVLAEQTPADPSRNWAPAYAFRMRLPGVEQVGRILKKHGIPYPGSRTPLDPAVTARLTDATWLAAEYAVKSAPQIARKLGVTQPRVRDTLERAGIPRRRPSEYAALAFGVKWPVEQQEQAIALYRSGLSARAVARELSLPRQWVFRLLERRGLTRTLQEARALKRAQKRERNSAL